MQTEGGRERILRELRADIASGRREPGSALPSARELGEQHQVSQRTASQAYEQLKSENLIYARTGVGHFVAGAAPKVAAPSSTDERLAALEADMKIVKQKLGLSE